MTVKTATTANQSLTNTLRLQDVAAMQAQMRQAQQNQQAAAFVGQVASNVVGDVSQNLNQAAQEAENKQAALE